MPSGIDIIHPMFWVVMAGDGLGTIEGLPLPCHSPVRLVSGNFIDDTMSTHYFCHVPIDLVVIHKERLSVKKLPEGFGTAKFLIWKLWINRATGNILRPVPSLLYWGLTVDTKILHGDDSDRNSEPTVHWDNLACVVDRLGHLKHDRGCFRVAVKLWGEFPTPIWLLGAIFTLLQFHPPHDRLPL